MGGKNGQLSSAKCCRYIKSFNGSADLIRTFDFVLRPEVQLERSVVLEDLAAARAGTRHEAPQVLESHVKDAVRPYTEAPQADLAAEAFDDPVGVPHHREEVSGAGQLAQAASGPHCRQHGGLALECNLIWQVPTMQMGRRRRPLPLADVALEIGAGLEDLAASRTRVRQVTPQVLEADVLQKIPLEVKVALAERAAELVPALHLD